MTKAPLLLAATLLLAPVARAQTPTIEGIPNFHQVTERIYRGAQPLPGAWTRLAGLGVKTVVDLRRPIEHSCEEESLAVTAAGMRYVNFPMNGFDTPTAEQLVTPLGLLDAEEKVFVHCKQGRDRTGTVIAAYRISRQGWENQRALAEARTLGLHWYENGMRRFISGYRPDSIRPLASAAASDSANGNAGPASFASPAR